MAGVRNVGDDRAQTNDVNKDTEPVQQSYLVISDRGRGQNATTIRPWKMQKRERPARPDEAREWLTASHETGRKKMVSKFLR